MALSKRMPFSPEGIRNLVPDLRSKYGTLDISDTVAASSEWQEKLADALGDLEQSRWDIAIPLIIYYGLYNGKTHTMQAVGLMIGMRRGRVSQRVGAGLMSLRRRLKEQPPH